MEPTRINRMQIFDDNVEALRTHVDLYIQRGFCETFERHNYRLTNPKVITEVCFDIAQQLGRPFVTVTHAKEHSFVSFPNKEALKHLRTPIILLGTETENFTYTGSDVQYRPKKSSFSAMFRRQGMAVLENWKSMVATDPACRAALNMPRL